MSSLPRLSPRAAPRPSRRRSVAPHATPPCPAQLAPATKPLDAPALSCRHPGASLYSKRAAPLRARRTPGRHRVRTRLAPDPGELRPRALAQTGTDSIFGRKTLVGAGGVATSLDTPPFYAWKTGNVLYSTTGGLDTDTDAHVLDIYGEPIPGLWASGGIMVYAHMGIKPMSRSYVGCSGMGFGGAIIWGRVAAQRICAEAE